MNWTSIVETTQRAFDITLLQIGDSRITLTTLLTLMVFGFMTMWVSRGLRNAVARVAAARSVQDEGSIRVAQRLLHYAVLSIATVVALQSLGIDLGALVAAGAVFAVGVGLAMQSLAQNFVSGVILLVERSIKPGDVVSVEGTVVRVTQMGIRSTVCRDRDGTDLIVPNSLLVQNTVANFTKDDRIMRIRVRVGVVYGSDMTKVAQVLHEAAAGMTWRRPDMDPVLVWIGFESSSVDWEISVWSDDPWRLPNLRTELATAIWHALAEADIVIAFPQVDVHLDAPVTAALSAMAGVTANRSPEASPPAG